MLTSKHEVAQEQACRALEKASFFLDCIHIEVMDDMDRGLSHRKGCVPIGF